MNLPLFISGIVVKGFGRGSKQLGIPTANFPEDVVDKLPKDFSCGIYFGWASVGNSSATYKMVMSVGWNPYYKNAKKSMETHILNNFAEDFYGSILRVGILGYLRPEKSFNSLDALIEAIHNDIAEANAALDKPEYLSFQNHPFFYTNSSNSHSL